MKKLFLGLLAATLFTSVHAADGTSAPAAPPPAIKDSAPDRYTVVKGDTLWGIAGRYLQDPWRWPEIWQANQQITNPHLIYPGDVLILCHIEDRTVVAVDQGNGCADLTAQSSAPLPSDQHITGSGVDFKLHPQIRSEPLEVAIPAIPLQLIRSYLNDSLVVDYNTLKNAPYVVDGNEGHNVTGAGDEIYARGEFTGNTNNYGIYRSGVRYLDPDTQEVLGYEATSVGEGKLLALANGLATVDIISTAGQEVRIDDKLLPREERMVTPVFEPSNPYNVKPGRIIRVFDSINSAANFSVIVVNRGAREGVKEGNTFALYEHGKLIRDDVNDDLMRLPSKPEGLAMVFRTFYKVSYALVLRANGVISVGDEIRPPISGD